MNYYLAEGTTQRGPFEEHELLAAGLAPESLVWREGMQQWQPAAQVAELRPILFPQQGPQPMPAAPFEAATGAPGGAVPIGYATPGFVVSPSPGDIQGKKIAAGICGIFFGTFGVHKFILGLTGGAVWMLCISAGAFVLGFLTCGATWLALAVMHVIGFIEGIVYLSKSDAEFYQTYFIQKRQWF